MSHSERFIAWWRSLTPRERYYRKQHSRRLHARWMRARRQVLFGVTE